MTAPDPHFVDFLTGCTRVLGLPDPTVENDSYMFQIGDRWIELKFDAGRRTVTTAAVACTFPASGAARADLVSCFNLLQLFNGGYAFVVDEDKASSGFAARIGSPLSGRRTSDRTWSRSRE